MASDESFVLFVADQAGLGPRLTWRRMFGEYALYVDTKVVAFIADNHVYLKPNDAARALLAEVTEAPAYPGSKLYLQIDREVDEREQLQRLLLATAEQMPLPKPKARRDPAGKPQAKAKAKANAKAAKTASKPRTPKR